MANLTFSDLQTEVYQQLGFDSTDTTNQSNVTRWLNFSQNDICAQWPWPFMEGRESIVTVTDITTGTCSVSSGATTVTFSTYTPTASDAGKFIQFSTSNDWYKVTASTPTFTIEQAYQQPTNLTNGTYTLRKMFYSLSSNCDRIIDIRNWQTPMKLIQVDPRTLDDLRANPQSTNSSYGYVCWGYDTSGNIQISPYPFPSDNRVFELRTLLRPVDGVVSIPNKYAHVICWGALSLGYSFLRRFDEAAVWNTKYTQRISQMKGEYRMSEDMQFIMRSIDSVQRAKWIQLPEQFPIVTSG